MSLADAREHLRTRQGRQRTNDQHRTQHQPRAVAGRMTSTRRRHPAEQLGRGSAELDETTGILTVQSAVVDESAELRGNFDHVFELFNLDPAAFIIDGAVKCSTWQQSKGYDDGRRDTVQLYAYSFRARKLANNDIRPEVVETWRKALTKVTERRPAVVEPDARPYLILVADPQLGKKGTDEAVENWQRGVRGHMAQIRKLGKRVSAVHVAFQGDEHENVTGNYHNQPHTIELNRSRQLELDFDLRVWTMREALKVGRPVTASSVVSNHGEWTRFGDTKEPVTTRNDNSSTHVARQVAKLFDELAPFTGQTIEWTIGETHPGVIVELGGVRCYFSHGYVEKGRGPNTDVKTRAAIERQILGRTDELGDVPLWFMAHYHHYYVAEFEGRTLFGCPALEAEKSSEYMLDQFGVWSPPGMLGMMVGDTGAAGARKWAHANVY